ncbi:Protein of unknown function [Rubritalea squalenifaciens DSM 18772]|uniref:DUF1376 domain-containing protein n=1 Tax=Rubritalea squalenifaciens DSM 18772 TaxID=1123071 RepID=A0A1M6C6M2_9BACT|nr:DUF1376 domain-containing protein [Rubritalea squalenifaciens]SHI56358.1 Protein of unknown function [Rubritalea squalenifaciens DSM 18772]
MPKKKSPAFQFYPKDYLCSDSVMQMSMQAQGAYMRMLCKCWLSGTLPADAKKIAVLIGFPTMTRAVREAMQLFTVDPDDPERLRHDRLDEEREKQKKNSRARAVAAKLRWVENNDSEQVETKSETLSEENPSTTGDTEDQGDAIASVLHPQIDANAEQMVCTTTTSSSPTTVVVEREKKKRRRRAPKESDCEVYARSRAPDEWKEFAGSVGREFYGVYAGQDWYKQTGEDLLSNKKWKYVLQVRLEAELRKENERGKRYTQRKKHAAGDRKTGGSGSTDKQPQRDKAGAGISVRSL